MPRQLVCRVCGNMFEIAEPHERRQGRLPHFCSAACKQAHRGVYIQEWRRANRWRRWAPTTLLELMEDHRRVSRRGVAQKSETFAARTDVRGKMLWPQVIRKVFFLRVSNDPAVRECAAAAAVAPAASARRANRA
jgi:hypothetical protein